MWIHHINPRKGGGIVYIMYEILKGCIIHELIGFMHHIYEIIYDFNPFINEGFWTPLKIKWWDLGI